MYRWIATFGLVATAALSSVMVSAANSDPKSADSKESNAKQKPVTVTLIRRSDKDYAKSAYSFKHGSGESKVHKGRVDLCYNNCGLVHVATYGGSKNRVVDLGKVSLSKVKSAPKKGWLTNSFDPKVGHTYLQEVVEEKNKAVWNKRVKVEQRMFVKFTILKADEKQIQLAWAPLEAKQKWNLDPKAPGAGAMGLCGGRHKAR